MNHPESISRQSARRICLKAQQLAAGPDKSGTKAAVRSLIGHLGYVQIDTISVVQRSHHHVFWTRRNDYDPAVLHDLQAADRAVFEYWGHAMSYLPIEDYRFALPRMKKLENPRNPWFVRQYEKCKNHLAPVLERIRREGPLTSKDFSTHGMERGPWWDWKPAKCALEMLFWRGDLMISERRNFQKVYDLRQRVLPSGIDTSFPTEDASARFLVRRALRALGVADEREIRCFLQPGAGRDSDLQIADAKAIRRAVSDLVDAGKILPATLEGDSGVRNYVLRENLEAADRKTPPDAHIHLLSPFDNLIIQRERLKRIFDFDYTLECYVPAAKRRHGYFVFPILWGDRFIGRLDPKADRRTHVLQIRNLAFESGFEMFESALSLLADRFVRMAAFNQCTTVRLDRVSPGKIRKPLERELKKFPVD